MGSERWHKKEDVLNDLEKVTGTRGTNIDNMFAVRGEQPPAFLDLEEVEEEDEDEFMQLYGQYYSKDNYIPGPDLSGITHMLRMVNDYYDNATCDDNANIMELKKAANTVISVSKLDPNAPEFVSRNVKDTKSEGKSVLGNFSTSETSDHSKNRKIEDLVCNYDVEIDENDTSYKNETNNNDIDVTKKIDVSTLNSSDIKVLGEKLKLKIVGTSKGECLKKKRERNLAMASLLKLYTDIPKSSNTNSPVQLMTPEDFQIVPKDVPNDSVANETEQNKIKVIKRESLDGDVLKLPDLLNDSGSLRNISEECSDLSVKTTAPDFKKSTNVLFMSKEVQESVKKVDKWLNGPENTKHKSRAVFFGPVTFQRKQSSSMNSSETTSLPNIDNIERPSSTQMSDSFVPSEYANELAKNYIERSKSKHQVQHEDVWTKLERQLQEKDRINKERLLSNQAQE